MARVLLLMTTRSYRARAFLQAARRLGVTVVVGSERRQALAGRVPHTTLALDFRRPARAVRRIAAVALEGLLADGALRVLALFDKPDPLDGPFFEETLYVTPSRLPAADQEAVAATAARAAAALGLRDGPLHAELRLGAGGPYVLEVAARSIGGPGSKTLPFCTGRVLVERLLPHPVGVPPGRAEAQGPAAGGMVVPMPSARGPRRR